MKKIYLASSWKNEQLLKNMQRNLVDNLNCVVDLFCNEKDVNRFCFSFNKLPVAAARLTNLTVRKYEEVNKAFLEDKKWLDWCDICILVLPAGKSSHLEAGYAKGSNKKLIIYNCKGFETGDIDVMYGFADLISESWEEVTQYLLDIDSV